MTADEACTNTTTACLPFWWLWYAEIDVLERHGKTDIMIYNNMHFFFAPQLVEELDVSFLFGSVGRCRRCCVNALGESLSSRASPTVPCEARDAGLFAAKMWSLWFVFPQRRAALRPVHLCRERS